jgi:hypothetical protein
MNLGILLVVGGLSVSLWGCAQLWAAWRAGLILRKRIKYAVTLLAIVGTGGAWLSLKATSADGGLRTYGLPLAVHAWERSQTGVWRDFVSPYATLIALGNWMFWIGLCVPIVVVLVKQPDKNSNVRGGPASPNARK